MSNGQMMTGLLYVPSTATAQTPAPAVVATEGYLNSADTMDGFAIELARRGVVVLDDNQPGQGGSAAPSYFDDYGGIDALTYLDSLPIVRKDDVGLIGHSMGGWSSVIAAFLDPTGYRSVVLVSSSVSTPVDEPIPGTPDFPRNVAVVEATNSEFSQLMWGVQKGIDIPHSSRLEKLFGTTGSVVPGRLYGSIAAGTGRELYMVDDIHPGMTFDTVAIEDAVSWTQRTLTGVGHLPASDQIWWVDELGTLLGMAGVVLLLFAVGGELLKTRFFRSVARPLPENRAVRGLSWWTGALLLVLTGALSYYWFQTYGEHQFPAGAIFPESITSGVATWAVGDACVGVVLFALWHLMSTRRRRLASAGTGAGTGAGADIGSTVNGQAGNGQHGNGQQPAGLPVAAGGFQRRAFASYGVTEPEGRLIDWVNIGKSLLLALACVVAAYVAVFFFEWAWNSDVRIWIYNVKPLTTMYLPIFLSYVGPFMLYFVVLSVVVFGQLRPGTSSLRKFMAIVTAVLMAGFVGLISVEYGYMWAAGTLLTNANSTDQLLSIVAFQFLPVFLIVGTVLSYFFYKTGRIWTGAFICSAFITAMLVTNTAIQGKPW